jgi:hypothetical protein
MEPILGEESSNRFSIFPDIDELQAVPRLMDNCTGLTEPPHGPCAPVQCEGLQYRLGAPATAK